MKYFYWMRQDLRIKDNEALNWALERGGEILLVYSLPSNYLKWGEHRRGFLKQTLYDLEMRVKEHGLSLNVTTKSVSELLLEISKDHKFTHLLYTSEYATDELKQEKKINQLAQDLNIETMSFDQSTLIRESDLPFEISKLPSIFTNFKNSLGTSYNVQNINELSNGKLASLQLPNEEIKWGDLKFHPWFQGGETNALQRLRSYVWESQSVLHYNDSRNGMLNLNDSSKFSPWLALGSISPRKIFHDIKRFEANHGETKSTYWLIYELLWRDYFKFYAKKYGAHIFRIQGIQPQKEIDFTDNRAAFFDWTMGETGEPFIDANMKELLQTGWMSNRGRQNVSNYLAKSMKINWTWGANWFEKMLIDYDPCQNWGNWNYTSGVGADPRDRLFNPKSQAKAYDPENLYQQKWLGQKVNQ